MSKIFIRDLKISSLIGVHSHERHSRQTLTAQLELDVDLDKAGLSDELSDSVDYEKLAGEISELSAKATFRTLEALGKHIVDICFAEEKVLGIKLTLEKSGAVPHTSCVGIIIEKNKFR